MHLKNDKFFLLIVDKSMKRNHLKHLLETYKTIRHNTRAFRVISFFLLCFEQILHDLVGYCFLAVDGICFEKCAQLCACNQ